jgi:hypothetical protein
MACIALLLVTGLASHCFFCLSCPLLYVCSNLRSSAVLCGACRHCQLLGRVGRLLPSVMVCIGCSSSPVHTLYCAPIGLSQHLLYVVRPWGTHMCSLHVGTGPLNVTTIAPHSGTDTRATPRVASALHVLSGLLLLPLTCKAVTDARVQ